MAPHVGTEKIRHIRPMVAMGTKLLEKKSGNFMVFGILLILLGLMAILFPFITSISIGMIIGSMFIIGGLFQLVHAIIAKGWSGFMLELVMSALYIGIGAYLVIFPIRGVLTLTVVLVSLLAVQGIIKIIMAFKLRSAPGWIWLLFGGLVSLFLSYTIFSNYPTSALWTLGVFAGIDLGLLGWSLVMLSKTVSPEKS